MKKATVSAFLAIALASLVYVKPAGAVTNPIFTTLEVFNSFKNEIFARFDVDEGLIEGLNIRINDLQDRVNELEARLSALEEADITCDIEEQDHLYFVEEGSISLSLDENIENYINSGGWTIDYVEYRESMGKVFFGLKKCPDSNDPVYEYDLIFLTDNSGLIDLVSQYASDGWTNPFTLYTPIMFDNILYSDLVIFQKEIIN